MMRTTDTIARDIRKPAPGCEIRNIIWDFCHASAEFRLAIASFLNAGILGCILAMVK